MAQSLPSLRQEAAVWAQIERSRVATERARAIANPKLYNGLTAMHQAYPYMPADAKLALGKAGVPPTSPIAGTVAAGSIKRKAKRGFGWHSIGDAIQAGGDLVIGKPLEAIGAVLGTQAAEKVGDVARAGIRTGFMALQAPLEEAGGLLRNIATGLPGKSGEFVAGAGAGAAAGAVIGNLIPIPGVGAAIGAVAGGAIGGVAGLIGPEAEGKPEWGTSSQAGIALGHLARGEKVEAGSGYFVGHKTHLFEEQRDRALRQARIAGTDTGWTVGRDVADVVFEPGTTPYNVMSGLIDAAPVIGTFKVAPKVPGGAPRVYAIDPAALALGKASQLNAARKALDPIKAAEFKLTDTYRSFTEVVAGESSPTKIARLFSGQLDNRLDVLAALGDADNADDVARILDAPDVLGGAVKIKPNGTTDIFPTRVIRRTTSRLVVNQSGLTHRQLATVPREAINFDNPADGIKAVDDWQAIGRVPEEMRLATRDMGIRALASGVPAHRLPWLTFAAQAVEDVVKTKMGAPKLQTLLEEAKTGAVVHTAEAVDEAAAEVKRIEQTARQLTRLFTKSTEDARHYSAMPIAEGTHIPAVQVAGDRMSITSPHLSVEFLTNNVFLPDSNEIARATGFMARAYEHALVPKSIDLADTAMSYWRRSAVLRPAYVPRTLADAQVRMAAASYDSIFRHPIDFIAHLVAIKGKKGPGGERVREGPIALTGSPLHDMEEVQGAFNKMSGTAALSDGRVPLSERARLSVTDDANAYFDGWLGHEVGTVASDPLAQAVMETMRVPAEEVVGAGARAGLDGPAGHRTMDEVKQAFWDGNLSWIRKDLGRYVDEPTHLSNRADADSYLDSVLERVNHHTRNDPDIIEYAQAYGRSKNADPTAARAAMERLVEEGNHPDLVVGSRFGGTVSAEKQGLVDHVTDVIFDHIAVRPENRWVREPVLDQAYMNGVERMMPAMDEAGKARAIALAREWKMPPDQIARMEARAKLPNPGGVLSREDVHMIAAREGANEVKRLLYSYSDKKQWGNATRLIFPFADVWAEMLKTWSTLLVQNPNVLRRGQQVVEGARGSGFFKTDENGEETFVYPGSSFISKMLVGAPIPLKATASGLNLFASNPVMPGFGPLAQWGAAAFLPDKPEFDWAQELISPYGTFGEGGIINAVLPPWARRLKSFMTSGEGDRLFNNTVGDMASYLVTSKGYSISTVEEQETTTAAAVSMAKRMYLLRAFAQSSLPSAPQPVPVAQLGDRTVEQQVLTNEYRKLQDEDYETAPQKFLERYGEDALLFMQPKSAGGSHPTEDALDWVRAHKEQVSRFPTTYGFFAPHAGAFDMTAYERQIQTGEREALTPTQRYQLANARVAQMRLRQVKAQIGPKPSATQKEWLTNFTQALVAQYEGFNPESFDPGKTPKAIRELERALDDPVMADTAVGGALRKYMAARVQATETAKTQLNLTSAVPYAKAKKAAPVRAWLRQVADSIMAETPEFAEVWDRLLSHELTTEDFQGAPEVTA